MAIVVQKYGGSSVKDSERFQRVARRIASTRKQGYDVVVVVSAPGDTTDDLVEQANALSAQPVEREMDVLLATGEQISIALLAIALNEIGCPAVSLTGGQAGVITNDHHRTARIATIDTARIHKEMADGKVVIVAGFQGVDPQGDITTLGRGGSDFSAIALAAYLGAKSCQIYTDVDGVYTADPRHVPNARLLEEISYDELLELTTAGAQVMQPRSVEFAKQSAVEFEVLNSLSSVTEGQPTKRGTRVVATLSPHQNRLVSGVALDSKVARITVMNLPDVPGVASRIFGALAAARINVDMIVQSASSSRAELADISFTCERNDLAKALDVAQEAMTAFPDALVNHDTDIAKVSVVGSGVASNYGVAAAMFEALAAKEINIELITGSEIKISCLVRAARALDALRAIHDKFELSKL